MVAIDAGHGGKDPGAVSADARYEKHVAMAVAGGCTSVWRPIRVTGRP